MKAKIQLKLMVLMYFISSMAGNAQVRPDIFRFTSAERTELANLIIEFVTPEILQYHCDYTAQTRETQSTFIDIHSDFDFLPFHRTYLERLEDWLVSKGKSKYVPLPKWTGHVIAPTEFRTAGPNMNGVDPDCADTTCRDFSDTCNPITTDDWDAATQPLPPYLSLPIRLDSNNDICDWQFSPTIPNVDDQNGLSRKIERPWHNYIHVVMGGRGRMRGVMGNFRSPAAAIFWLWHAMVDDVWKSWEQHCPQSTTSSVDLYIKDNDFVMESVRDRGEEPNIDTGPMWRSKDIWIRNQDDGVANQEHQNPEYGQINYVYVRVRNRGYQTSLGTEKLKLYWAKANTALSWPDNWNGSLTVGQGNDEVPLGSLLDTKSISPVKAQGQTIVQFAWSPPNPASYTNLVDSPHHFCLLARIEATNDPMSNEVNGNVYQNTKKNNNIAWKNLSVVDLRTTTPKQNALAGATVFIGNIENATRNFYIEFESPRNPGENNILDEAEIKVTLDQGTWDKWEDSREILQLRQRLDARGGITGSSGGTTAAPSRNQDITQIRPAEQQSLKIFNETRQVAFTEDEISLENLEFGPNERTQINVKFNFLVKKMSGQKEFNFNVIQRATGTNEIIGGETFYIIANNNRQEFYADAGDDIEISPGETTILEAYDTEESTTYRWHNLSNDSITIGRSIRVSPTITTKYKLEVTSNITGNKDYDEVEVRVKKYRILSITPNPASNQVTISYRAPNVSSAHILLVKAYGSSSNHTLNVNELNVNQSSINIDLTGRSSGIYFAVLVCDGQAVDSKSLVIE